MLAHHLDGFSVNHINDNWTIDQKLDRLSLYKLEGTLSQASRFFEKELTVLKEMYLNGPVEIRSNNCVPNLYFVKHDVVFNEIVIRVGPDHDGQDELQIWGIRNPTKLELEWLETNYQKDLDEAKERRKKEFEKLKKEFENE